MASVTLNPTKSIYVATDRPANNYNGADYLRVGLFDSASTEDFTYLHFDVPAGEVTGARLRMLSYSGGVWNGAAPFAVAPVEKSWQAQSVSVFNGSAWVSATPYVFNGAAWVAGAPYVYNGEWNTAMTCQNRPPANTASAVSETKSGYTWYEWDVTSLVAAGIPDGILVYQNSRTTQRAKQFYRTGANAPQLIVTTAEAPAGSGVSVACALAQGTALFASAACETEEIGNGVKSASNPFLLRGKTKVNLVVSNDSDARFGVSFSGAAPAGTRLFDAANMSAAAGVDDAAVENGFDGVLPFSGMRRCNTALVSGKRAPTYFEGEAGYSNTEADVFVYVPLFWYSRSADDETHTVSMKRHDATYRAPAKFYDENGVLRPYCFLPAYTAGVNENGVPVSRSGYYPHIASLNGWMALAAQKHGAAALDSDLWIEGTKDDEIKNILMDIEFATRNHQSVMMGACNLRYALDEATAGGTNQFTLEPASAALYKAGQMIAIGTTPRGQELTGSATITAVNAQTGVIAFTPASGSVTVAAGNYIVSRPWKSGACDSVKASSGSPESNESGVFPCIYRGIENPFGNQLRWRWDYLQSNHAPSILLDPAKYAAGALTADYEALAYAVPQTNGYATKMGFDARYPFARVTKAAEGSATTYFSDYFSQLTGLCALCVGGTVFYINYTGSRCYYVNAAPATSGWSIGAALCPR